MNTETIDTDFTCFNGMGEYEMISTPVVSEVTVLFNAITKNHILFLSHQENGPLIVDSDLERAKKKFLNAFGGMLIMNSIMSTDETKGVIFKHAGKEYKSLVKSKKVDLDLMTDKLNTKMANIIQEVSA